jgi:hypothetical protein
MFACMYVCIPGCKRVCTYICVHKYVYMHRPLHVYGRKHVFYLHFRVDASVQHPKHFVISLFMSENRYGILSCV